jgi:TRAP-type C4-dicarboxylate transport system permease small subunit
MGSKGFVGLASHLIIMVFLVLLIVSSVRYLSSFYTPIDPLGDKKLTILFFLITLAVSILGACFFLRGYIYDKQESYHSYLKMVEIGVPFLSILINLGITFINFKDL